MPLTRCSSAAASNVLLGVGGRVVGRGLGGLLGAAFLLLMMHGNHVGRVEDWFLAGFAALVLGVVARSWYVGRNRETR